jgi:HSP20 family protein
VVKDWEKEAKMNVTTTLPIRREKGDLWDVGGELDRLFDTSLDFLPAMTTVREGLWHPTMDVYDLANEIMIEFELPGMKMEDLCLQIEESHLVLEGNRKRSEKHKEEDRFYMERMFGKFHRVVHLPSDVDADCAEARFADGLLTVRLPKVKRVEGKKIDIKAA